MTPRYARPLGGKYSTHAVILDAIGENRRILDLGCNEGYLGKYSSPTNSFYGIDSDPKALEKARGIYRDVLHRDLNLLDPLPWREPFDVLLFADILEHLVDPEKVLRHFVKEYGREGSLVILSLPNVANWTVRLKLLTGTFEMTETGILDRTHLHLYTYDTARVLCARGGLELDRELFGSSAFGAVIARLPFLKGLLAHSIVFTCRKRSEPGSSPSSLNSPDQNS